MPRDEDAHALAVKSLRMVIDAERLLGELKAHADALYKYLEIERERPDGNQARTA